MSTTTTPSPIIAPGPHHASANNSYDPAPSNRNRQQSNSVKNDPSSSRILIVDDDPELLKLVSRMVACLGYACEVAGNAMDALFYLNRISYHLVLTDYNMPVVDGYQLADQIKKRNTGTEVIIMTGYCEDAIINMLNASDAVDGLLLKPFTLATLREKIEVVGGLQAHLLAL